MIPKNQPKNNIEHEEYKNHHIGVLDGIRAISILIIMWFHIWQQSWLMPIMGFINLDWIPRYGYLLVDMMVLLSGFCLFLPYANQMVYGKKAISKKEFYIKRIARIMPSYYISILIVLLLFVLPNNEYVSFEEGFKDIFTHLVFIHNWFADTLTNTPLIGALWTVALEAQFYIIFPFIAKAFYKNKIATYICMTMIGLLSSLIISINFDSINQILFTNNTLTFFSVYANGIMGAYLYVKYIKNKKITKTKSIICTLIAVFCIFIYKTMCQSIGSYNLEGKWQVEYRFLLSIVYLVFILSTIMSVKSFKKIWDNRIMSFIAKISFNLYIWHCFIILKLKEYRIPEWEGDIPPNMASNQEWQWKYTILCWIISFVIACIMTYGVEIPISKYIRKKFLNKEKSK